MKRVIIWIVLTGLSVSTYAQTDWSVHLERADKDDAYCKTFYELMEKHKDENPTAAGYFAVSYMMLGKSSKNPFAQLKYFNKGRELLDETILSNPENVELRFLRFAVQIEVPVALFYFSDKDEDKERMDQYVLENNTALSTRILNFYKLKNLEPENTYTAHR